MVHYNTSQPLPDYRLWYDWLGDSRHAVKAQHPEATTRRLDLS